LPPSSTRLEVEEEIVRILSQMDESTRLDPVPLIGTISAVGTITAPMLDRGTLQANRYDGRQIKVAEDATAVAFVAPVTVTGVHTAVITTLTVSSTAEIRSGDVLEIGTTLEKVLVRAVINATTLTVTRGFQGTTATATGGGETVRYDPVGWVTGVDDGGFATGGVLTISPNFAVAGYGAGSFYMYPKALAPDYVVKKLNAVLRNTDHPYIWFPSLVTDSDFASNSLTNWGDVLAPTKTFETTGLDVYYGERYLLLGTNAASEGVHSARFTTHENEQLLVSVVVSDITGDGIVVQLYNETAASVLHATGTIDENAQVEAKFLKTVPANMKQGRIRFLSTTATAASWAVLPPVIVQSDRRRSYPAPSWFTRESQLKDIVCFPDGYTSVAADSYIAYSVPAYAARAELIRSERSITPMRVLLENPGDDPTALIAMRPFAELGGDSTTTVADKDYLAFKTVSNILRDRKDNAWKHWAERAATRARIKGYGGRDLDIREQLAYAGAYQWQS
jgi:hypothetical protein